MVKRGRKQIDPEFKKEKLQIYIQRYKIENVGGFDETQNLLHNLFNKFYEKNFIRDLQLEKRKR